MAAKTHCVRGHEFTHENTYLHGGKRHCRECRRIHGRRCNAVAHQSGYHRRWRKDHPFTVLAWDHRKRARVAGAVGSATADQIQARVEFYGEKCWLCGSPWQQIDHVIPFALGGAHYPANIRPVCARCNLHKAARHPKELVAA